MNNKGAKTQRVCPFNLRAFAPSRLCCSICAVRFLCIRFVVRANLWSNFLPQRREERETAELYWLSGHDFATDDSARLRSCPISGDLRKLVFPLLFLALPLLLLICTNRSLAPGGTARYYNLHADSHSVPR